MTHNPLDHHTEQLANDRFKVTRSRGDKNNDETETSKLTNTTQ